MTELVDKEAQEIWDELAAKDADKAPLQVEEPSEAKPTDDGDGDTTTITNTDAGAEQATDDKTKSTDAATDDKSSAEPDIWADAKPEQRSAVEAIRKEAETKAAEWKRMAGTVSSYQRQVADLKRELEAAKKGGSQAADDKAGTQSAGLFEDPEVKKAADEYPEIFGPIRKVVSALEKRAEKAERELGTISSERRAINLAEQGRMVEEAHPDYDLIAASPQFREWYDKAPPYVRAAVERNAKHVVDGAEVAHVVNQFKLETGWKAPANPGQGDPAPANPKPSASDKRRHQLQSASTPSPKGPARVQSGPPDDDEGAWRYWAEQDRRNGAQT